MLSKRFGLKINMQCELAETKYLMEVVPVIGINSYMELLD